MWAAAEGPTSLSRPRREERPFPGVCDPSRMVSIVLFLQSSGPQPCHTTQVRGGTVCACLYTLSVGATCTCGCALLRLITNRACLLGVLECVQRAAAQRSNYTVCDTEVGTQVEHTHAHTSCAGSRHTDTCAWASSTAAVGYADLLPGCRATLPYIWLTVWPLRRHKSCCEHLSPQIPGRRMYME